MEHELVSPGNVNFNLGCVPTDMCAIFGSSGRRHVAPSNDLAKVQGRNTRPIQLCYECCDTNGCNHHACKDSIG